MKLVNGAFALALTVGCGGTSTMPTAGDAGSDGAVGGDASPTDASAIEGSSSCGLELYPDTTCRSWLDQNCCAEEHACASNASCKGVVDCVNRCPTPRADACILACGSGDAGAVELNAVADCSKQAPPPPGGANCSWP